MSRCPHCKSRMLSSPWCPICAREWSVMVYTTNLPAQDPPRRICRGTGRTLFEHVLSDAEVMEIKATLIAAYQPGKRPGVQRDLAKKYNVSSATIARIWAGARRADVGYSIPAAEVRREEQVV